MNGYASEFNNGGLTSLSGPTIRMFGPQGFIGGTTTMGTPGSTGAYVQNTFLEQNAQADAAVRSKMANAIDPVTGHLLKQPQTQGEWAEVERQAQTMASDTARNTFKQEAQMLGFNPNAGGTGLQGGKGGTMAPSPGGGGVGGSGAAAGPDPQIMSTFKNGLLGAINSPGMSKGDEQALVGQNAQGLGLARDQSIRRMQDSANASGFQPSGGSQQSGMNAISQDYAGKIADSNTNTHLQVDDKRRGQMMQALGLGNSYLESQARLAAERTNAAIALMNHNQPAIPNVTGGGIPNQQNLMFPGAHTAGGSGGKGGGGNGGGGAGFNWSDPSEGNVAQNANDPFGNQYLPRDVYGPQDKNAYAKWKAGGGYETANGEDPNKTSSQQSQQSQQSSMQALAPGATATLARPMSAFGGGAQSAGVPGVGASRTMNQGYNQVQRQKMRNVLMAV